MATIDGSMMLAERAKGAEPGYWAGTLKRILRDPSGIVGAILLLIVVLAAVAGPLVYRHDPNYQSSAGLTLDGRPIGPGAAFPLGTDTKGRDLLARLIHGASVSLFVAVLAIALAAALGIIIGGVAGISRTLVREPLMRGVDVVLSFPTLLLAMVLLAITRPSILTVAAIIGVGWGAYLARIVYGITSSLAGRDLTASAICVGASRLRLLFRHILPHVLPAVVVYVTLGVGAAIQLEAIFGYVGVGLQPPDASWGNMIADGQGYLVTDPRLVFVPAAAVAIATLAFVLLGDALRDALEPDEGSAQRKVPLA